MLDGGQRSASETSSQYNKRTNDMVVNNKQGIKLAYVIANMVTVAIGFLQFGFGVSSWGNISPSFEIL